MKKLTLKKTVSVMIGAAFLVLMAGCGSGSSKSTSTDSMTYNGITKTVTTITENGKTTTQIEYTDESGKKLDEAEGESAFESAKAEVEDAEDSLDISMEDTEEAEEAEAVGEAISATLTLANDTSTDITEIYLVEADDESWGDNLLKNGAVLEAGKSGTIAMTYTSDMELQIAFVNSNDEDIEFDPFVIGDLEDPENVTITFTEDETSYYFNVN